MLESFLQLLTFLPAGLIIAAACLEGFVLSRRDRDSEPGVLWLLCCTAITAAIAAIVSLTLYFIRIDPAGLRTGWMAGCVAATASAAWLLKRQARNRALLLLREVFYDPANAKLPPRRKPWQGFLILGYRGLLALAILLALTNGLLSPHRPPAATAATASAAPLPPNPATVAATKPEPPAPAPVSAETTPPPESLPPALQDPTKSEIPSADASAMAAMATSTAIPSPTADPANPPAGTAAVPVVAMVPEPAARPVSKNSLYFSKVRPIFAKSCVSCHGPQKQKGDLRLDTPDFIRAGVNGKQVIVPGVPEKSRVYHVTGLPPGDSDLMPPKGTPLNSTERGVLAEWIKNGADLGDGVSIPSGHDGIFLVDSIAQNLTAPDPAVMEDLKKDHVVIRPLSKNGFVLELDFSHSDRARSDLKLSQLGPIAINVYALDFSRTNFSDADLGQLLPMKNLSRLLLSRTSITDAGLAALKHNVNLEQLNLYDTPITDAGLPALAALKSLKKVYLWQSKATPAGAKQLQEQVPGLVVSIGE